MQASLLFPWTQVLWPICIDTKLTALLWILCRFHQVELYVSRPLTEVQGCSLELQGGYSNQRHVWRFVSSLDILCFCLY